MTIWVVFAAEDFTDSTQTRVHGVFLYGVFTNKSEATAIAHEKDGFVHEYTLNKCQRDFLCGFSESPDDEDE